MDVRSIYSLRRACAFSLARSSFQSSLRSATKAGSSSSSPETRPRRSSCGAAENAGSSSWDGARSTAARFASCRKSSSASSTGGSGGGGGRRIKGFNLGNGVFENITLADSHGLRGVCRDKLLLDRRTRFRINALAQFRRLIRLRIDRLFFSTATKSAIPSYPVSARPDEQ